MTTPTAPRDIRQSDLIWDFTRLGLGGRMLSLAAFALAYAAMVQLGLALRESSNQLTILWPAAGLLFITLWLTPMRNWVWLIAIQICVEWLLAFLRIEHFHPGLFAPFPIANALDAIVGATVIRQLIATPEVPRLRYVLRFIAAVALGAAASAAVGAFGTAVPLQGALYLREWQLWWASNWLGSLTIAPVIIGWAVRWRVPAMTAPSAPLAELLLIGLPLFGMTIWIFSAPPGSATTILDQPFVVLALVIVAAFRLPPRWSTAFAALTAILAAFFAGRGLGPFEGDGNPFLRAGAMQLFLAALVVVNFMLTIVLLEMRHTMMLLRTAGERYRNFVEQSSEAIWRIELRSPMPAGLAPAEQAAYLRAQAYVAECNVVYHRLNRQIGHTDAEAALWREDAPWSAIYLAHLETAARQGYSVDDVQFTLPGGSRELTYIAGFRGVIEAGQLVRVWGVARDVTELMDLNEQLRRKQDRLKSYARQLVGAEERARRATAVDLHDGIGQQLVGLAMTLEAVVSRSSPEVRLLLGEATHTVREVQAITQRVIADLSPPGLYELGLEPALKWLSVYMRGQDNLQISLQISGNDAAFDLDLRVLVFKLIRELLRNVVKHAGVQTAAVTVSQSDQELRVVVEDHGVGFEWQLSLFEARSGGFGLWSVADRVREAAGEITVDTAPGRGCRVTVVFPIGGGSQYAERSESRAPLSRMNP